MYQLLLVAVLTAGLAPRSRSSDPLLLEYSDYYYDLYYGDYDNYDDSGISVHSTAPRSIRVEKPGVSGSSGSGRNHKIDRKSSKRHEHREERREAGRPEQREEARLRNSVSVKSTLSSPAPGLSTSGLAVREPLNVRLQRLLSADQSSAWTILDILQAPRSSQVEIMKFLRGVTLRIEEERERQTAVTRPSQTEKFRPKVPAPTPPPSRRPPPPTRSRPPTRPPPTRPPPPPPTRSRPTPTRPPPTRPPPTRPPPKRPPPTRPPPTRPPPTRPPPTRPPPTRPPPTRPPPTRPPPTRPPPTRPPPPPPTRPPSHPPTHPPPPTRPPPPREPRKQSRNRHKDEEASPTSGSATVTRQFNQFPNFQSHQQSNKDEVERRNNRNNKNKNNERNKKREKEREETERPRQSAQHNRKNGRKEQKSNRKEEREEDERGGSSDDHSPTSSSGLTIEEFLTRYPEVKRLSSRFGDDVTTVRPVKPHKQKSHKKKAKSIDNSREEERRSGDKKEKHQNAFTAFFSPATTPLQHTPTQSAPVPTTVRTPPRITPRQRQTRPPNKSTQKQPVLTTASPPQSDDQDYDYDFGVVDYDYYYDQLVPEHERFFQLPKTSTTESPRSGAENGAGFQVFTHFSEDRSVNEPGSGGTRHSKQSAGGGRNTGLSGGGRNNRKEKKAPNRKSKVQSSSGLGGGQVNTIAQPKPKPRPVDTGPHSGPFGYTQKGTFFSDSHFTGFPEKIDMVYQGFVWAFTIYYPDQPSLLHGGVHTILEDKVKRETLDLAGDHIVRVTGRASPYNINRLTFYTRQGRKFGPWGDRHSDESVDFDVSAPPGQGLAFFSGTIDFGVPLRSVSFHWRPIQ